MEGSCFSCLCRCTYRFGIGTKYIFVVDANHILYVHRKKKGAFHHSSFLKGRSALCAGGIVVKNGKLLVVNSSSGHYKPSKKVMKRTFGYFEQEKGLPPNTYYMVYPRVNKPCGCACCKAMPLNAPCALGTSPGGCGSWLRQIFGGKK